MKLFMHFDINLLEILRNKFMLFFYQTFHQHLHQSLCCQTDFVLKIK
jgi:hypothetical protein